MNQLKRIKDIFAISKDNNTIDEMNRVNVRAGLVMGPVVILFEVLMIVLTAGNIAAGGSPVRVTYMQCYVSLLVVTIISVTLLIVWRKNFEKHRFHLVRLTHIYSALIILWAVAITALDISRGGSLTVYLTVLVVLACAFYLHPWAACFIFIGSATLLMILAHIVADHTLDIMINLFVFVIFMSIASVVRYGGRKESVFKESVIVKQNQELNQLNEQLSILSRTDMLTKLYNRRYYDEAVPIIADECARNGEELAAVLLDIDEFKKINDTYGHKVGDECIRSVARIILNQSRKHLGTAYRFGGEEFLVVMPDCTLERAAELAENIRKEVEATPVEGVGYAVTISAGCYAGTPEAKSDAEAFVVHADHMMYRAKANGRNGVELYREG